ncbi:helix-turn-helix domain-containing protein [Pseudalkalibacillus caeni]|nr:helix-turn-helix domain-containing protein [Pseudalkalibacillus caeni]
MKEIHEYPPVLSAKEVAEIYQCSVWTAYDMMERKDFPLVRVGRLKRVGRDAFIKWLEKQANEAI